MIRKILVHQNQLILVFRNGALQRVLSSGAHWLHPFFGKETFRLEYLSKAKADFSEMPHLIKHPLLKPHLEVIDLGDGERALVWVDERLQGLLEPGVHGFWKASGSLRIERLNPNQASFSHPNLDQILKLPNTGNLFQVFEVDHGKQTILYHNGLVHDVLGPGRHVYWKGFGKWTTDCCYDSIPFPNETLIGHPILANYLESIDLVDDEVALVWVDNRLNRLLAKGSHAMWRSAGDIRFERITLDKQPLQHPALKGIIELTLAKQHLHVFDVGDGEKAILTRDGVLEAVLEPGIHVYWKGFGKLKLQTVSIKEQVLDMVAQEMMTLDKVSLRLNIIVAYRMVDILQAVSGVQDIVNALYRQTQLILRTVVGARNLDELLTDKRIFTEELEGVLKTWCDDRGLQLISAGIRDIILPGDMKTLLNQVTEAKKRAESELIRRREETASARSQANTARLFAQNPTLMRLRELETVESIMKGSDNTFLFSNGNFLDELQSKLLKTND